MRDYVRRRRWIRTRIRKPQLDGSQFGDGGTPRSEAAGGLCVIPTWQAQHGSCSGPDKTLQLSCTLDSAVVSLSSTLLIDTPAPAGASTAAGHLQGEEGYTSPHSPRNGELGAISEAEEDVTGTASHRCGAGLLGGV